MLEYMKFRFDEATERRCQQPRMHGVDVETHDIRPAGAGWWRRPEHERAESAREGGHTTHARCSVCRAGRR
jgi:hypothetical protein